MKKRDYWITRGLDFVIRELGLITLASIVILNIAGLFMDGMTWSILHVALCVFSLAACYFVIKSGLWSKKWFWTMLICIGMCARIVYTLTVHVPIRSDQLKCLEAAESLAAGDKSWVADQYFQRWAFQIPFVIYESIIIKVFGSVSALYVFSLLESFAIGVLLYLIIREITEDSLIPLVVAAMYALAPSYIMHQGLLYNNILGGVLWLVAVYVYIATRKNKFSAWGYFLCGIALAMSQAIRSEAIVWLLAIVCFGIYEWFKGTSRQKKTRIVFETLSIIIGYRLTLLGISNGIEFSGLGSEWISNYSPYWHLVCGFAPDSYGEYSVQYAYILDTLDHSEQRDIFFQIMKEIIGGWNVKSFTTFWIGKMYKMWGADNGPFAYGLDSSTWMQLMLFLERAVYVASVVFSFIGIKDKENRKLKTLMTIAFLGFFCAFLLKEISVKYRYNPGLCLFLLSAFGILRVKEGLEKQVKRRGFV